jgi:hypothetical protein
MLLFLGTAEIDQIVHKAANNIAINIIKLNMVFNEDYTMVSAIFVPFVS